MKPSTLLSFYRSSAAFRVRIALNIKNIDHNVQPIDIVKYKKGGAVDTTLPASWSELFAATKAVPIYQDNNYSRRSASRSSSIVNNNNNNSNNNIGSLESSSSGSSDFNDVSQTPLILTQSLAIIEYLDEMHPDPPLLPSDPGDRAYVRSLAYDIACDVHPLNNLRVLRQLKRQMNASPEDIVQWQTHWLQEGFVNLEGRLRQDSRATGQFCFGNSPTLADICLVPQVFNCLALASISDFSKNFPTLSRIYKNCLELKAFRDASWEQQADSKGQRNPIL